MTGFNCRYGIELDLEQIRLDEINSEIATLNKYIVQLENASHTANNVRLLAGAKLDLIELIANRDKTIMYEPEEVAV